jgi:hypothetical protein
MDEDDRPLGAGRLAILTAVLAVGAFLRFYHLGTVMFWEDEPLHQVRIAYQPVPFIASHNNSSALSTLLVHFLLFLGRTEFAARLGSAVCGVLIIFVIFVAGRRMFSAREGLMAAAFVAVSPYLIQFAQCSRGYSLLVLLALLSLYYFYRNSREARPRFRFLFGLFMALAIYDHLMALFLLPAYAFYIGVRWLAGRSKGIAPEERRRRDLEVLWFGLTALGILTVNVLLYSPNADVREFLQGSASRAASRVTGPTASLGLIGYILKYQLAAPVLSWLTLALATVGVATSWKRYAGAARLAMFYLLVPYILFIALQPRETNVLSADRYFIFILPVLLLLTCRGLVFLADRVSGLAAPRSEAARTTLSRILAGFLAALLAAGYFSPFRKYYRDFWRLGSLRLDGGVVDYLRNNVKRDAPIYFDFSPLSSQNVVVNPLTRDLRPEEVELVIRSQASPAPGSTDLLFFALPPQMWRIFVAGQDVELWAVVPLDSLQYGALRRAIQARTDVSVEKVGGFGVLRFPKDGSPVSQKLTQMTSVLLALPLASQRARRLHLVAAKAYLSMGETGAGYEELNSIDRFALSPELSPKLRKGFADPLFDRLFGYSDVQFARFDEERLTYELRRLLLWVGNTALERDRINEAMDSYARCAGLGSDLNAKILENLSSLSRDLPRAGRWAETARVCQTALQIDGRRQDFQIALAEALRKMGETALAAEEYKKVFSAERLPEDFFERLAAEPETVFIWQSAGRWNFLLRSARAAKFSGRITSGQKIRGLKKIGLTSEDSIIILHSGVAFSIGSDQGLYKSFSFEVPPKTGVAFALKINSRRDNRKVMIIPVSPF